MAAPAPKRSRAAKEIERRMFLKAIALGASVPIAMRLARVATAAPSNAPRRFFLLYVPHGTACEHFAPKIVGGDRRNFSLNQTNVSILGALEPYKQYVNVYEGFQYLGDAQTHEGVVNCLTGSTAADTTAPRTSVEHVIAKALNVKPLILGACSHQPYGLDKNGMLFWNGTPIDPEKSPVKAADMLFGGGTTTTPPPVSADVQLRRDLLTFNASEIQKLQTTLNSFTRERGKLQRHLESVQALQSDMNTMMPTTTSCSSRPSLPTVEMVRRASANNMPDPSNGNDYFYQAANFPLLYQAQLELVTQALICNAARVIGLMPMYATCDFDFGFAGAPGAHHNGLSHTMYQAAPGAQYNSPISITNLQTTIRAPFATAQKWLWTELVNRVVKVLATTDDPAAPGTKVLDNTLIYVMSEIGDGQDHNRVSQVMYPQVPTSLPLVTIGKCAGAITSGQVVQFPIDEKTKARAVNRPASDLYLTMARAMGAPASVSFPGQTGTIEGVLSL